MSQTYSPSHFKAARPIPATSTLQLVQILGPAKASRALGVSQTTLKKIRENGRTHPQNENTAASWIKQMTSAAPTNGNGHAPVADAAEMASPGRTEHAMILLDVPLEKVPVVEKLAQTIGAEYLRA